MKLTATREALLSALQVASRAVSTRSAIQALSGVLIEAGSGSVQLRATDMEIGLSVPLEAEVQTEGSAVVPGRLLLDIVRSLPGGQVTVDATGTDRMIELSGGQARFEMRALPGDEFPNLPEPGEATVSLPAGSFVATVNRVARSASSDEARPILTGVHVTGEEGTLTMAATDSYRLAVMATPLSEPLSTPIEANIPARALRELSRLLGESSVERVDISMLGNQVVFRAGEALLSSRLIDGQFPNYRQLLPESYDHEVRMNREELLDVVRRISLMAQKNAPLRMAFSEGELTVSAKTPDVGEAREAIPVGFQGETLEIGFNPEFIREGIESAESEEITFKLINSLRPGLIEPVADDDDFRYLAMPIRLNA